MVKHLNFLRRASVLVAWAMPLACGAAVETFNASIPLTATDYSDSLAVNQFDPSLGTLQSITITAAGSAQFSQYYQNLSTSSAGSVTISQNADMILSQSSIGTIIPDLNISTGSNMYTVAAYTGTSFFTAPSGGTQNYTAANSKVATLGPADFAPFIGSGMADFLLAANGSGSSSNTTGNFLVGWTTSAGVNLTVAYNYIAVPESEMWMAGTFAVAGLTLFAVRRSPFQRSRMK